MKNKMVKQISSKQVYLSFIFHTCRKIDYYKNNKLVKVFQICLRGLLFLFSSEFSSDFELSI